MAQGITPVRTSVLFESPWLRLEALDMESPDPKGERLPQAPYYRLVERPGVICVTLSSVGDFVLVRQHRPALGRGTLEFPAGGVEDGEAPDAAARREVLEETGMRVDQLVFVGTTQPVPSRLHAPQSMFIGIGANEPFVPSSEKGAHIAVIPRASLMAAFRQEGMDCPVALGIIKLAELLWTVDLFNDSIDLIRERLGTDAQSLTDHPAGKTC